MPSLQDPVTAVRGVGPKLAEQLATLEIETVEDLLTYFPARYDEMTPTNVQFAKDKQKLAVKGTVMSEPIISRYGYRRSRVAFRLLTGMDVVQVTFFNQPYLAKNITANMDVIVTGTWDAPRQTIKGTKVITKDLDQQSGMGAVYSVNKHIKQATLQKTIRQAFTQYERFIPTLLPVKLRQDYQLMERREMIAQLHFPTDRELAQAARRTAAYEEFFLFELRMLALRQANREADGLSIQYHNDEVRAFIKTIPFELTNAQKRVVNEICRDLKAPYQMNRLLQGDVGSGKTIVAAIAIYAAITAGYQVALMAPTEILATQHAQKLAKVFAETPVNVGLLTGGVKPKAAEQLRAQIAAGQINLIVGTHALIQDKVEYANLGLAIIDEQHRFGVKQRQTLREKGNHPDVLAMTATPIPRTIAITTYGEMDVSIIDELPAGRQPIQTQWLQAKQLETAVRFLKEQLATGAQVYIVSPLIEESESLDVQNATALAEEYAEIFAPTYQVGLLHGRMTNDEKAAVMDQFQAGDIQVLVSTTVIEVGVDNPNATVMMIYNADRFGLAQLHQLRGRVGRGQRQSYCLLLADPKTDDGKARMETMVATTDGFVVAQRDLELRGSGDVLGKRQSGMPAFKVGDPVADLKMLQIARRDASELLANPAWENTDEYQPLALYLHRHQLATHFD
ncbi:ATP-dependent DNA helicase RecG [Limosilactobacillus equigenerosi]|uniref:ATP-dependent DNA helicase RecG n=1 Tax=Limosilactobacillus equigenerosi DSM 18793 = JCM 14505 TaxID=1423742 RepID=A0A0R1UQP9_9LACO|nr:ATP-dependent DNA helicase RecG [Limosilactobacillus equigenerosi]KRL93930.1 ATP-dependent DNA helicase RecG [Limosilactobacillus equigenerosi DSM 18793 = JCM 14505]